MFLKSLTLQHFRSYTKASFVFEKEIILIIGPNTAGKSNIIEAIYLLSIGKSFRAEKDMQMVRMGKEVGHVRGMLDDTELEVVLTTGRVLGKDTNIKRFLINGVAKRRTSFAGILRSVLFSPTDLELIIGGPSVRRAFLDAALEQVDTEYRMAADAYSKALRQRNALLENTRETGRRVESQFDYWDSLVIQYGQVVTAKREMFIAFLNSRKKDIFPFFCAYDRSTISKERLKQYKDAEESAGVTLVGPHRDDFQVYMDEKIGENAREVKVFGSRGQQRLIVLQLKLLQKAFIEELSGEKPLLLLDDIFSELDQAHIELVLEMVGSQQTIMTATHK